MSKARALPGFRSQGAEDLGRFPAIKVEVEGQSGACSCGRFVAIEFEALSVLQCLGEISDK